MLQRASWEFSIDHIYKEKGKFEDMAKADKAHCKRDMKTCISYKGETKKKFKDPSVPKRLPLAFFLFCSEFHSKNQRRTSGSVHW